MCQYQYTQSTYTPMTSVTLTKDALGRTKLIELLRQTPEFKEIKQNYSDLFDNLTKSCGGNPIDMLDFWCITDTLFIEEQGKRTLPAWATPELRAKIAPLDALADDWINGKGLNDFGSVSFKTEFPKIRGGGILWAMIENLKNKADCILEESKTQNNVSQHCKFMNPLKYYVYSNHDTTLSALFGALGFTKTNFDRDGFPHYSACATIELWQTPNSTFYIKFLYWPPDQQEIKTSEDLTANITGCENGCTLDQFAARSGPYKALPTPRLYCDIVDDLNASIRVGGGGGVSLLVLIVLGLLATLFGYGFA